MVIFHSYVSLPEGKTPGNLGWNQHTSKKHRLGPAYGNLETTADWGFHRWKQFKWWRDQATKNDLATTGNSCRTMENFVANLGYCYCITWVISHVPIFHITQPWSVYGLLDGYYKVMSNIPKSWDIYQPLAFLANKCSWSRIHIDIPMSHTILPTMENLANPGCYTNIYIY